MKRIFISYSRKDKDQVFALKDDIEQHLGTGICWLDLTGVESDKMFVDTIIEAIDQTEIFLFMYSHHSEKPEWTRKEIEYATHRGKKVVFVKLENRPLSKYYQFQFGGHDIIELADQTQREKLFNNLMNWLQITPPQQTEENKPVAEIQITELFTPESSDHKGTKQTKSGANEQETNKINKDNIPMYYFINAKGQQQGPVAAQDLLSYGVNGETLVWKSGMNSWTKAKDVPELYSLLTPPTPSSQGTPTPPPYGTQQSNTSQSNQSANTTAPSDQSVKPNNYLPWAIAVTACCCLPGGIYAIICSSKVDSLYKQGNYEEAAQKAAEAKKWTIISAIVGGVVQLIYYICCFALGLADAL